MKTPEQLKGAIRNMAKEKKIAAQDILQVFMFERIIERLSKSEYREKFILKGGLLISAMVGIAERTTMDMDTTVKGLQMEEAEIRKAVWNILRIPLEDGVIFEIKDIQPIREDDEYNNFRVSLQAVYGKMKIPMKIDITTGDKITPREISYQYPFLFEDKTVSVMAYSIETILAEKYETIIRRNIETTRARDFYDLHLLFQIYQEHADWELLRKATYATAEKRESLNKLEDADRIIAALRESDSIRQLWQAYQRRNEYTLGISYEDVVNSVELFKRKVKE